MVGLANRFQLWSIGSGCLEHCIKKDSEAMPLWEKVMGYSSSMCYGSRRGEWEPACHISAIVDRLGRASYAVLGG